MVVSLIMATSWGEVGTSEDGIYFPGHGMAGGVQAAVGGIRSAEVVVGGTFHGNAFGAVLTP